LPLRRLIKELSRLPGVGEKTATRFALFLLNNPTVCETLGELIKELPYRVKICKLCRNFAEGDVCNICLRDDRDPRLLCVVESPVTLAHIENTGIYKGYYFVLHYLLSPRDGIGPKDIGVEQLKFLIKQRGVEEVIIAVSPTFSGEATANYLAELLKEEGVRVSKLACGIPMGMEIQFVDSLTLKKAIKGREVLNR